MEPEYTSAASAAATSRSDDARLRADALYRAVLELSRQGIHDYDAAMALATQYLAAPASPGTLVAPPPSPYWPNTPLQSTSSARTPVLSPASSSTSPGVGGISFAQARPAAVASSSSLQAASMTGVVMAPAVQQAPVRESNLPVLNGSFQRNAQTAVVAGAGGLITPAPPPAPKPHVAVTACIREQRLTDNNDVLSCNLGEVVSIQERLGSGVYGTVYRIKLLPGANARGLPLAEDVEYAMKMGIEFGKKQLTEIEIGEVLRRSAVPLTNLVPVYYWMRWRPTSKQDFLSLYAEIDRPKYRKAAVYAILFMSLEFGCTLNAVFATAQIRPARGPAMYLVNSQPLNPKGAMNITTLFTLCLAAQIYAAFAAIRMVIPTFVNSDVHGGNIMLSTSGLPPGIDSLLYVLPWGTFIFVPLVCTGDYIVKLIDMGLTSGSYQTVTESVYAPVTLVPTFSKDRSGADFAELSMITQGFPKFPARSAFSDAEAVLTMMHSDMTTSYPHYYIDALGTRPEFAHLRIKASDRSTLDALYLKLVGVPRLRNFDALRIVLGMPGSSAVQRVESEVANATSQN